MVLHGLPGKAARSCCRNPAKTASPEGLANSAKFTSWECGHAKMNLTAEKKALYLHCLPGNKLKQIVDRAQRLGI